MRPQKYSEETKIVSVRIPLSKIMEFKKVTDEFLKKYANGGEPTNLVKTPNPEIKIDKPKWQLDAEKRNKRGSE